MTFQPILVQNDATFDILTEPHINTKRKYGAETVHNTITVRQRKRKSEKETERALGNQKKNATSNKEETSTTTKCSKKGEEEHKLNNICICAPKICAQ